MSEDPNISRSGRVRKKSSKLTDYQNPEDLDGNRPVKRIFKSSSPQHSSLNPGKSSRLEDLPPETLLGSEDENLDLDLKLDDGLDMEINVKEDDFEEVPDDDSIDVDSAPYSYDVNVKSEVNRTEIIKRPSNLQPNQSNESENDSDQITRVTGFMLWSKQTRVNMVTNNPSLDQNQVSNKLAELWKNVSTAEKYNWKRKAQRLSARSSVQIVTRPLQVAQRAGPVDVAAHLTLLGESLSVIGERLTEHEGQIAVSGSLSVLLDSLLCSLGPLLCLTQRVPELDGADPQTLAQILDNVAYIMPGL